MADSSLMDFGEVARTAIGLGSLLETRRHNDILEQNSLLEAGRLQVAKDRADVDRETLKQNAMFKGFDEIEKLKGNPAVALNPVWQAGALHTQLFMLKNGLGARIPELNTLDIPTSDELLGSLTQTGDFLKALRSDDPAQREAATNKLFVAAPQYATRVLDEMKKANDLNEQGEQLRLKLELNKAQLGRINLQAGRYALQQGFYTEHVGALGTTLHLADSPEFKDHFYKMMSLQKEESRATYLKLHPEFNREFQKVLNERSTPMPLVLSQLSDAINDKGRQLKSLQAKNGTAPAELAEELSGFEVVRKARQIETEWLNDPYNKDKWNALKKTEQDVRILQGTTTKRISGLEEERLKILQQKVEDTKQQALAGDYAQEQFLDFLQQGNDDNQAASLAIKATKEKYPGVPFDTGKLKNLNKVGKQEIGLKLGQEDQTRQYKLIENSQNVLDFANDLKDRIHENPMIIGRGAQLGTAFAGAGQQLRAIAQLDPGASRLLNTKTRDEAEAMYEVLVYMQARTMDPSGPLDLKVVEHARQVIGPIDTLTSGPQQLLNKLDFVTRHAEKNIRRARRNLKGGPEAYLNDEPKAGGDVKSMSDQELLNRILQGLSKGGTE